MEESMLKKVLLVVLAVVVGLTLVWLVGDLFGPR